MSSKVALEGVTLVWLVLLGLYSLYVVLFVISQQTNLLPPVSILMGIDAWPYLLASAICFFSALLVYRGSKLGFLAVLPCLFLTNYAWGFVMEGTIAAFLEIGFCLLPLVTMGSSLADGLFSRTQVQPTGP